MQIAVDIEGKRILVFNAIKDKDYLSPIYGNKLIFRF